MRDLWAYISCILVSLKTEKILFFLFSILLFPVFILNASIQSNNIAELPLEGTDDDDSRIRNLNDRALLLIDSNIDSAHILAIKSLGMLKKSSNDTLKADIYNTMGLIKKNRGDIDSALYFLNLSISIAEKTGDAVRKGSALRDKGTIYYRQGSYDLALTTFLSALKIFEQEHHQIGLAKTFNNLGNFYATRTEYDKALLYYKKAIDGYVKSDRKKDVAATLTNIGSIYYLQHILDSAQHFYEKGLKIYLSLNETHAKSITLLNLGNIYFDKNDLAKALTYYQESYDIFISTNNPQGKAYSLWGLGLVNAREKRFGEAIDNYLTSLKLARAIQARPIMQEIYRNLSLAYEELNDYQNAYRYLIQHNSVKDSLLNIDNTKKIAELEAQYEHEKNLSEIEKLQKESAQKDLTLSEQKRIRNAGLALSGFVMLIVIGLWLLYRIRRQKKEIIYEKERIARLEQFDRLKDQFLANTSHELKTPLQGIIGLSEAIHDRIQNADDKNDLDMIISSGKRLSSLVNDILDFSQLKNSQLNLQLKPVDIHSVVEVILKLNEQLVLGRQIELINDLPKDSPLIQADENRLQQILQNLVGNAIKFTQRGYIRVSASLLNNFLEIVVDDSGKGIEADKLQVIFNAFEQEDGSISREYSGTGLGLSITKQLVELHGGTIWVESTPEKGSKFHFTMSTVESSKEEILPRQIDMMNGRQISHTAQVLNKELKVPYSISIGSFKEGSFIDILVVDDEVINHQVLKHHLTNKDYRVFSVMNGEEALQILKKGQKFDLVILDIMMPRMSGYEVCKKIREQYLPSELPIIIITAKDQLEDLIQGFNLGANDYLSKPFTKDELLARVKTHLNLLRINQAYHRFVPNEFIRALGRESIIEVNLGDQVQSDVTVFFSDIRAYTSLSEKMTPKENFSFLNNYLQNVGPVITNHHGFVSQYYGDGIMALFMNHPSDSIQAAIKMQQVMRHYNKDRLRKKLPPVQIGIGMHSGSLMLGILGDNQRMNAAVVSDTVNTASRMEGLTKHYGVSIVASETTMNAIQLKDQFNYRFLGKVLVKGKQKSLKIYDLFDGDDEKIKDLKLETKAIFEEGIDHFMSKRFTQAAGLFEMIRTKNPADKSSYIYHKKCAQLMIEGVSESWEGLLEIQSK